MRYPSQIVMRARALRRNATLEERILWQIVRNRKLGYKFRRQHPLPPYVLDFYCPQARVAVELDGAQHDPARDKRRDDFLRARDIIVMRVENYVLRNDPMRVVAAIQDLVAARIAADGKKRERESDDATATVQPS